MGLPFSSLPDLIADYCESGDCVLFLLGPVVLGCCRLQQTSLSSMILLHPPFFAKDGVVILCVRLGTVQY